LILSGRESRPSKVNAADETVRPSANGDVATVHSSLCWHHWQVWHKI